jgi:ParB/RepB/Spo0J family partition protein
MNRCEGIIPVPLDQFDLDFERLRRSTARMVAKMAVSFSQQGQLTPVITTERRGLYLLVDGFKRYRAAEKIGLSRLNAIVVTVDGKKAKAMLYLLNHSGGFSIIQEALLVKELIEIDGWTRKEAALLMDRHKSWISRRLDMIRRLSPEVIEALLLGQIAPGAGSSLARIPLCNQPDVAAAIQTHHLSPNEVHRLVDCYRKAPHHMKPLILQSPRNALAIVGAEMRVWKVIVTVIEMLEAIERGVGVERRAKINKVKDILYAIKEEACD